MRSRMIDPEPDGFRRAHSARAYAARKYRDPANLQRTQLHAARYSLILRLVGVDTSMHTVAVIVPLDRAFVRSNAMTVIESQSGNATRWPRTSPSRARQDAPRLGTRAHHPPQRSHAADKRRRRGPSSPLGATCKSAAAGASANRCAPTIAQKRMAARAAAIECKSVRVGATSSECRSVRIGKTIGVQIGAHRPG